MGVAKAKFYVSLASHVIGGDREGNRGIDFQTIVQLMSALPQDTVLISLKDLGIQESQLAMCYELELQSKYLKDGAVIDMEWRRNICIDPDTGSIKQFANFQGLINTDKMYTNNDDFQARQGTLAQEELDD